MPDAAAPPPPALPQGKTAVPVAVGRPVLPSLVSANVTAVDFGALVRSSLALPAASALPGTRGKSSGSPGVVPDTQAAPVRPGRRGKDEPAAEPALPAPVIAGPAPPQPAAARAGLEPLLTPAAPPRLDPAGPGHDTPTSKPEAATPPRQAAADTAARVEPASPPPPNAAPPLLGAAVLPPATTASGDNTGTLVAASVAKGAPTTPAAQIAHGIGELSAAVGANRVMVQLTPTELGRVTISIVRDAAGGSAVNVTAERADTLALVRADAAQLHAALDQAGIGAHGRSLTFHLADPAAPALAEASVRTPAQAVHAAPSAQHAGTDGGGFASPGGQAGLGAHDRQPAPHQGRPQPGAAERLADDTPGGAGGLASQHAPLRLVLRAIDFTA